MFNSPQFKKVLEQMNTIGEKLNSGLMKTTHSCISAPQIQVTCFDDEAYNDQMKERLENPNWKETESSNNTANDETTENLRLQQSSGGEKGSSDDSNSDDEIDDGRNCQDIKKRTSTSRKTSSGSVFSSQAVNRNIVIRKMDKQGANVDAAGSNTETTPRPSVGGLSDSRRFNVIPSTGRRRSDTICSSPNENVDSCEPSNNSESNNRLVISTQNSRAVTGDHNAEIKNGKKKPKRIDLTLEINSAATSAHSNQSKTRAQTFGTEQKTGHLSHETLSQLDESLRAASETDRPTDDGSSTVVRAAPREVFLRPQKITENSLSIPKEAGVISNTSPTQRTRISSSFTKGTTNSTSVDVRESHLPLRPRSHSDLGSSLNVKFTDRPNFASPQQGRRLSDHKPNPSPKSTQFRVGWRPSLSKSDNDVSGKLTSKEDDPEHKRRAGVPSASHARKSVETWNNASVGVSGNPTSSKSDSDPRKLASDTEVIDIKTDMSMGSPQTQSQRLRSVSSSRQQPTSEINGEVSPLSLREERKIYLAAAQPMARVRNRVRSRSDLQATSQIIIDQAEKELDQLSERLPQISMEQVMRKWQTDRRHWNVVSTVVNPHGDFESKANMDTMRGCRYIRQSVVTNKKRKKNSN